MEPRRQEIARKVKDISRTWICTLADQGGWSQCENSRLLWCTATNELLYRFGKQWQLWCVCAHRKRGADFDTAPSGSRLGPTFGRGAHYQYLE